MQTKFLRQQVGTNATKQLQVAAAVQPTTAAAAATAAGHAALTVVQACCLCETLKSKHNSENVTAGLHTGSS